MEAPSHESDAWTLGASLYFALEQALPYPGRRPGEPWDSAMRHMQHGGDLQPIVAGLLRDDPRERLSIEEALQRLEPRTSVLGTPGPITPSTADETVGFQLSHKDNGQIMIGVRG